MMQLLEIARLRFGRHKLRAEEYYDYRLFAADMSWQAKQAYTGSWIKDRIFRVQDPATAALCSDKLKAYRLFDELGLPYPRVVAFTGVPESFPGAIALMDEVRLAHWLRHEAPYPIFVKPAVSYRGFGNALLAHYDRDSDSLVLGNDDRVPVSAFASRHGAPKAPAVLFQELIRPHPALAAVIGNRAATARLIVLNDGPEPELWQGGLRLPAGKSMVDNFRAGKSGNMLARLDLNTGKILTVYTRIGVDQQTTDRHPDTNAMLAGFVLPDWPQAVALVKAASKAIPGLKIHSWDVAFTDAGPLLVETNPRGDFSIPQIVGDGGAATPRLLRLYENGVI